MLYGLVAYGIWGAFPLYFALLQGIAPLEVVAYRVIWSLAFLVIVMTVMRGWRQLRAIVTWRVVLSLAVGAILLSVNWGTYVYAVQSDRVVEASLGYFINPLVSVGLGVLFLGERLRRNQWIAVALAVLAVLVLTVTMGTPPWISLILAFSFGLYGLVKKRVGIGAAQSLLIETAVLFPIAIAIVTLNARAGSAAFGHVSTGTDILLMMLGPVTAIPLMAFGAAATRIPLSTLGILQYLTPVGQFLLGVTVFNEAMTQGQWIGFGLVWIALVLFSLDTFRATRARTRTDAAELAVVELD